MSNSNNLLSWLFETDAVRVCPGDKPFWYTSGTIGPYYINTHFLYGNEQKANEFLNFIDKEKENIYDCPQKVLEKTLKNYESDNIYRGLIDEMISFIMSNMDIEKIDAMSGGERRDWFFSLIIAKFLNKPHITIYKDLSSVISVDGNVSEIDDLENKKVLHIADLITEASSYERAWIPAIKNHGGEIKWSFVVVDRKQGGKELLNSYGVESFSMVNIDKEFFKDVYDLNIINSQQLQMIEEYIKNPKESMELFLKNNPNFLKEAIESGDKSAQRAKLCIEKKIYNI